MQVQEEDFLLEAVLDSAYVKHTQATARLEAAEELPETNYAPECSVDMAEVKSATATMSSSC